MNEENNKQNLEDQDWEVIGGLDFLFGEKLNSDSYGNEIKAILIREFNLNSFTLFSYDFKTKIIYDMIEGTPLEYNLDAPFLTTINSDSFMPNSIEVFKSHESNNSWLYCQVNPTRILTLVFEDLVDVDEKTLLKIRGVLRVWYLRLQYFQSRKKRERLLEQITQFRSIGESLAKSHRLEDILTRILNTAIKLVDAEKGHIMVYNEESNELKVKIAKGFGSPQTDKLINEGKIKLEGLQIGEGIQGQVFQSRRAMRISEQNPLLGSTVGDHLSVICVPLAMNDEVFGVLHITNKKNWAPFEESDLDIINILATNVAAVLNKQKLFKRSSQDHLTGLANRGFFEEKAKSELSRSLRYKNPFSLLMVDVDFFKRVNDSYGHLVGDEVLKFVSTKLQSNLRTDIDLPARFGGEEFVIILPETDSSGALIVAERIRKSIETAVIIKNENTISVTVSIGITQVREGEPDDLAILYERADLALYWAKEHGRNQCNIYDPAKMEKATLS